jgi:hypothetical protein
MADRFNDVRFQAWSGHGLTGRERLQVRPIADLVYGVADVGSSA